MNINKKEFKFNGKTMISNTAEAIIKFGGVEWYVIGVNEGGTELTLFRKDIDGMSEFDKDSNSYYFSRIRRKLINIAKLIHADDLNIISQKMQTRDGDIEDKLFLLSYDEMCCVDAEIRECSDWYWLRTPVLYSNGSAWMVSADGVTAYNINVNGGNGVRPACVVEIGKDGNNGIQRV